LRGRRELGGGGCWFCEAGGREMAAPAATAPAMASLGASRVMGVGESGRGGGAARVSSCVMYGSVRRVACGGVAVSRLRGCSVALAGAGARRLLLASRSLTHAVSVSSESSVAVKAADGGDVDAPAVSSKPVMTLEAREVNGVESDSVGLKPPPLKPAPKPQPVQEPQPIEDSGVKPRPVLLLNRSGPTRPQQVESSAARSLGEILENVEKLGPSEAGGAPGRAPVRARPGAWKAGDKIRTKAERERDAAAAAEAAAAERRAQGGDGGDAQASTSDVEIVRTQRPRMQLNTTAKPVPRPAPAAARKGPVLKDVGSAGPRLRDAGAGPVLKDVGAGPRSQPARSSTPPPASAALAGPPKPFAKAAIKVGIALASVTFSLLVSIAYMSPASQAHGSFQM
jgi:hypothetical protein